MIGLYNIVCLLVSMVPMLAFISAAVVSALYSHPYFASVFMMFSILTVPKLSLGARKKEDKNKDEQKEDAK